MTKVVSYLRGIPNLKNPDKPEMLKRFVEGVNSVGDTGIVHNSLDVIDADVAVLQGWVHDGSPTTPHLRLRKKVAETQQRRNKNTIIIDSNLFNYIGNQTPTYLRYSMNGVFPTTGNYFNKHFDPARWEQIKRDYNIDLKPWRKKGRHILICTQRNGGWSMQGNSVIKWLNETVAELKKHTDRPIVVRGHPGDRRAKQYLKPHPHYVVSQNKSILQDFQKAWAVVTYNSTPSVAASIEGIPAFVTDPIPQTSQAYDVSTHSLSLIETPQIKDREVWIKKICMCHWNFDELSNGDAWRHMRKYI